LDRQEQLFTDIGLFMEEVRTGEVVRILRGDYALMRSTLFGPPLFFHVPSSGAAVTKEMGARIRRFGTDGSLKPRVALNSEHPIVVEIERFLRQGSEQDKLSMSNWLSSFCDGVVEDRNLKVPAAKWSTLKGSLEMMTGMDLDPYSVRDLRMST
jgi:hypothetical protein